MVSVFDTAVSGLNAAAKRIEVGANNIANQNSTQSRVNGETTNQPFTPQRVDLVSLSNAGVQAVVSNVEPATQQIPDGEGGLIESPNVNVERELVGIKIAAYDYKANIKAIQVQDKIEQSLLDIIS